MKQLVCEICGGKDLVKQDGLFVCQSCGCKYSVEEAKKMMVEGSVSIQGTVDVSGTVKIDNSDVVENSLVNARRACKNQDWLEAEKYYNIVQQSEPTNIEANFYSSYARARSTLMDSDFFKKKDAFGILTRCVSIIDNNYDICNSSNIELIQRIANDILSLYNANFTYIQKKNGQGIVVQDDRLKNIDLFSYLGAEFVNVCLKIASAYPKEEQTSILSLYKIASSVADVSCKRDYAIKIKKLANPDIADDFKQVTFVNNYSGFGKMNIFITIPGVFDKRLIPQGTTIIEFFKGEYEMIMYCSITTNMDNAVKKRVTKLRVPTHSRVEIIYKFLDDGYNFKVS